MSNTIRVPCSLMKGLNHQFAIGNGIIMPAHPAQDFHHFTPTPEDILPAAEPDKGQEYFFNFGYQGEINTPKKTRVTS